MTAKLIAIGNSKGIRLPKAIIEAAGLEDSVTLRVAEGGVVISPARKRRKPRQGWAEAIRAEVAKAGMPEIIDVDFESLPNEGDAEGWKW